MARSKINGNCTRCQRVEHISAFCFRQRRETNELVLVRLACGSAVFVWSGPVRFHFVRRSLDRDIPSHQPNYSDCQPMPLFHPLPDGEGPSTAASSDDTVLSVPRLPWLFSRKAVVDDAAKINPIEFSSALTYAKGRR